MVIRNPTCRHVHAWAHLWEAESGAEDPRQQQHQTDSARSSVLADWVNDRHASVDTDDDNDVGRQVQTEHLSNTVH